MICMSLRIRVRLIKKEEYFQTVGVLAGMKEASETDRIYEGEELADEMMVFAGVTGSHLDQILFMMRKKGMKRIDYKAVLTVSGLCRNFLKNWKRSMQQCISPDFAEKSHFSYRQNKFFG